MRYCYIFLKISVHSQEQQISPPDFLDAWSRLKAAPLQKGK